MEVIHERVAGLDVHKDSVVACVRIMSGGKAKRECRTFGTTTAELEALRDWITSWECTLVAMEATGVYWLPIWKILLGGAFEMNIANARHIKAVPGRKTDMNDAMWIADLAAYGLIRASFVPDEEFHELRTLTRTRKQLVRDQTSHVQRIQKTLTEANIRLDSVISDIMGVNGRRMIEAIIEGVRDPGKLAALGDRRLKATRKELHDRAARPPDRSSPLPALTPSGPARCAGEDDPRHRRRGGAADRSPGQAERQAARRDPLVPTDRIAGFDSGGQLLVRDNDHFGDRQQHEPLSRLAGHLIAWAGAVSRTERERGQTGTNAAAACTQGCAPG